MDFLVDDVNTLADIYALESFHSSIVKDSIRVRHMEAVHECEEIIMEAFSDVIKKMGEYFKRIIQALKDFFKKILMYIASYFMDIDKFVKKYKSDLDKIKKINFTIYGWNFKLDTKPDLSELQSIISSYNSGITDAKGLKKKSDIIVEQNKYLSKDNLDALRGKVLGTNSRIDEDDFAEEVRKHYRDGELETIQIEVDDGMFREVVNGAQDLSKQTKEAEKLRDETIMLFSRAEKFFSKSASTLYHDGEKAAANYQMDYDEEHKSIKAGEVVYNSSGKRETIDAFIRFKYNQTKSLGAISNLVVKEYANAYKDKVKMYREILRKSLFDATENDDDKDNDNKDED